MNDTQPNDDLADLVSAFDALLLEAHQWEVEYPPDATFPNFREGWFAEGPWDGSIIRRVWEQPSINHPALETFASYSPASNLLRDHPIFGPLIGMRLGSTTLNNELHLTESFLFGVAETSLLEQHDLPESERTAILTEALLKLRTFVNAPVRRAHILAPISHLRLDQPFELDTNIVFDRFTTYELLALATNGTIRPSFVGDPVIHAGEWFGIRITHEVERLVQAGDDESGDNNVVFNVIDRNTFGSASPSRMFQIIDDVLLALRLSRPGFIGVNSAAYAAEYWDGLQVRTGLNRQTRLMDWCEHDFNSEQRSNLLEVWRLLKSNLNSDHPLPEVALSRFSAAVDRGGHDDRIMDLVIALEALLINGGRSELQYRASLHGALLLERAGHNRRDVFHKISAAYDLRSTIAHGDSARNDVKIFGQSPTPVHEFVQDIENLVRAIIIQALHEVVDEGVTFGSKDYWRNLTLGEN